jgi:hypothetical protein
LLILSSSSNTWEPIENVLCKNLIDEYELSKNRRKNAKKGSNRPKKIDIGFDQKHVPEEILSAITIEGKQIFSMKWKTIEEPSYVFANTAKVRCPQLVFDFYEKELKICALNSDFRENIEIGFDKKLQPKKILGPVYKEGIQMFVMKWKETEETDYVLADTAKVKCPELVFDFYEERRQLLSTINSNKIK